MKDADLPTLDEDLLDEDVASSPLRLARSTETIDLDSLFTRDVSPSGSFDIRGDIWETTFGRLLQALPIPALLIDSSNKIFVANQACRRLSDQYESIQNQDLGILCPSSVSRENLTRLASEVLRTRKPRVGEYAITLGGRTIWARMTFRSIRVRANRWLLLMIEDLTLEKKQLLLNQRHQERLRKEIEQREQAQKAVEQVKEEWELTFHSVRDLIAIVDTKYRIRRANRALTEIIGSTTQQVVGMKCFRCFHGTDEPPADCPHTKLLIDGKEHSTEIFGSRLGGVFEATVFPLQNRSGQVIGAVHVARNITERKRMELERDKLIDELSAAKDALEFQATHDPLTSMWNRTAILDQLRREVERARREGSFIGLIMIDLDNFKKVNDTYGHLVGDTVLREAARRMTTLIRPYDSVGRFGGEEFVVILPGCKQEQARGMAERLCSSFSSNPITTPHGALTVTLSCGAGVVDPRSSAGIEDFVRYADEAMYRAKRDGRNRVEVFA
jgi:diguanylate cyclase (GGDEF)-like protein/PAS domain S-box-containing protein